MIFRQGEFVRVIGQQCKTVSLIGQIVKVHNCDFFTFPYEILVIDENKNLIIDFVNGSEIERLLYKDAELEIGNFLKAKIAKNDHR